MIPSIVIPLLFFWTVVGAAIGMYPNRNEGILFMLLDSSPSPYQKAFVCFLFGPLVQLGALIYFIWWLLGRLGKSD